ncbi:MAG: conjugal transfer protein TrbI [Campylobacterales bacterium]|nr:conjugal transfer protein TrbI [Campylobacterales bacterium]
MNNLDPNASPQGLNPSGGVKKLNKIPLMIVIGTALIVFLSLGYTMYQRGQMNAKGNESDKETNKIEGDPNTVVASLLEQLKNRKTENNNTALVVTPQERNITLPIIPNEPKAIVKPSPKLDEVDKEAQKMAQLKAKLLLDAITSPTKIKTNTDSSSNNPATTIGNTINPDGLNLANSFAKILDNQTPTGTTLKNEAWIKKAKDSFDYVDSKKTAPLSPYEIKTGTIIPGILITAVNSELPGQILGQVSENVYDTATGNFLLIPQGTKIIGEYNSDVTFGQSRLLIAWKRLIFPNGHTLNIGAMNGTDKAGGGGFADQVDNHYFRIFGSAFLLTLLNGDMVIRDGKLTIKEESTTTQRTETTIEKAAAQMIEKQMAIAPTINIRSGYKFNVFVTKDMIIEPYSGD